ncbi:phosphatidylinositol-specific phospholipase C domain-containing protein [Aureivirga marina]|uniref:phosphatidylinositol-specific phospholipase C domain-containing protein n=1 Tax=Aureivirga marina TaxID=1182451 RepID=UPI0018CA5A72|nr:phosphatidylinositol-specific phospholipase C domain-containing protein [Aureivirga marina]
MKRLHIFTAMIFFLAFACQKEYPELEASDISNSEENFNNERFTTSDLNLDLQRIPISERRIHEIINPSTHNSYNDHDKYEKSNVFDRIPTQLSKGIRGVEIDIHKKVNLFKGDDISVYHGKVSNGINGSRLAHYVLREITDFAKDNPNEIIYLKFETTVSGGDIDKEIREAELDKYIYDYNPNNPYPKPEEIIATGKNVVITRHIDGSQYGVSLDRHTFGGGYEHNSSHNPQTNPSANKFFSVEYYAITSTFGYGDSHEQKYLLGEARLPEFVDKVWKLNGKKPWRIIVDFPSVHNDYFYQIVNELKSRQMLKAQVYDKYGNLFMNDENGKLITWKWMCTYNNAKNDAKTSAEASFPMKKGETVTIQPYSDDYYFVPPILEVTNDGTTDLLQNFVAIPKPE